MFSAHFNAKHFRDSFQQPHPCDPSPVLCSVAFRSSFIRRLLLDLYLYGGNDSDGRFPLFYRQVARELAPKLAEIFRHLVRAVVFRHVGGQKESASSDVGDNRPIFITSILPKVFEKIMAGKLGQFGE